MFRRFLKRMNCSICTLGTASQAPTYSRALNSTVVRFDGSAYLIDAGEGTQQQLGASTVRHSAISTVLITHLHGDHCFGLPGMMCLLSSSRATSEDQKPKKQKRVDIIEVYGPVGLARYLRTAMTVSRSLLSCKFRVNELIPTQRQKDESVPTFESWPEPDEVEMRLHPNELPGRRIKPERELIEDKEWNVWPLFNDGTVSCIATELLHHVPAFGFVFQEAPKKGLFLDKAKLEQYGLLKSPLCGKLTRGESVEINGETVRPEDVTRLPLPGRKITVLGDCHNSSLSIGPALDSNCVLHESTMEDKLQQLAREHGHSTPSIAVKFAINCRARKLIVNHFSQRYKKESAIEREWNKEQGQWVSCEKKEQLTDKVLLDEARRAAVEMGRESDFVAIAEDLKVFDIKH